MVFGTLIIPNESLFFLSLNRQKRGLGKRLQENYGISIDGRTKKNLVNVMTNEFPSGFVKKIQVGRYQ